MIGPLAATGAHAQSPDATPPVGASSGQDSPPPAGQSGVLGPSSAANQAPGASGPAATTSSGALEDITVTSRRRAEPLQQVPAAVTAFSAADLESAGVEQPSDFLNITPGVYFRANTTAGTSFINIRSVTQSRNAESPVAVVIDGVYLNNPLTFQDQLIDIQQVEVLKGPQGALYGRNADAGAILITTNQPTNDFEGYVRSGIGRHAWNEIEGAVGGPIIPDTLLFRVVAYENGDYGYLENKYLGSLGAKAYGDHALNEGGRGRLLYFPNDILTFDSRFSYSFTHTGFNNTIFDPDNRGNSSVLQLIPYEPDPPGNTSRRIYNASEKIDARLDLGTLTSISAYNDYHEESGGVALPYTPQSRNTQWLINAYRTFSQEIRFTSPGDQPLRYIAGAFYEHTNRFFGSSQGLKTDAEAVLIDTSGVTTGSDSVNPALSISDDNVHQDAWAVFGQVDYDVLDDVELSAAIRYDRDQEKDKNTAPDQLALTGGGFTYVPGPDNRVRSLKFGRPQPKGTIRWTPTPTDNLYVTYAEGFKNGGFNPSTVPLSFQSFGEEVIKTEEVGYKGQFLDRRLGIDVSGYHSDEKGVNFFDFIPAIAAQINVNINKIEIYGIEGAATARLTDELTGIISANYTHSEIQRNQFDAASIGKRAPAFPDVSATLTLNYEKRLSDQWNVFARADYNHVGTIQWDLEGAVVREPLNLLDLRAGVNYGPEKTPWRLEVFCRNCTNLDYINESVFVSGNIGTVDFPVINAVEWGVELTKKF